MGVFAEHKLSPKVKISYGEKYTDEEYHYKNVELSTKAHTQLMAQHSQELSEAEWRSLGIHMASGWEHIFTTNSGTFMGFRRSLD